MKEYYERYSADLEAFVTPLLKSLKPVCTKARSASNTEDD